MSEKFALTNEEPLPPVVSKCLRVLPMNTRLGTVTQDANWEYCGSPVWFPVLPKFAAPALGLFVRGFGIADMMILCNELREVQT